MPRRKPHISDPDNPDEVKRFVTDLAKLSNYSRLQALIDDDLALHRPATLERRDPNKMLDVNCPSRKAAIAIHVYGKIAEKACRHCEEWDGPFVDCILLEGYENLTYKCCSNCRWNGYTSPLGRNIRVMQQKVTMDVVYSNYLS